MSDRLHVLQYSVFETASEDQSTKLERITANIDKHVPIELRSDQTDAANDRRTPLAA